MVLSFQRSSCLEFIKMGEKSTKDLNKVGVARSTQPDWKHTLVNMIEA